MHIHSEKHNYDEFKLKRYIDFDKYERIFFYNFYFEYYKIVLKIPLNRLFYEDVIIEKFDLTKYIYLFYCE